ncbi:Calmodulin-3 [Phytophthora pseudosyringae]|uniref:Calmodulin-3 n=1 Tax=Phytophthora pseudosyringae TaxID=221518 RepID=A0A8T1WH25_9STRA|nr:Calmodulin-3 [Phytophthora pseudosyringae]
MVRVGVWRSLALLTLCHSCLPGSSASISVIERAVEPTAFVTAAATSDLEPIWLLLPVLLDVQPVLLRVDVTRHVAAQVQSFCRAHGVDTATGAGAIRQAVDEVADFQRFCKKPAAESALPGFVVTKNALRASAEASSASWMPNDPGDVAMDFCGFAQASAGTSTDKCVEALGEALRRSFDWMFALTPCEQQAQEGQGAAASNSEAQSIADRLATVEEMIAALQSTSAEDSGVETSEAQQEPSEEDSGASVRDEDDAVEEISETEEASVIVTEEGIVTVPEATATVHDSEENEGQMELATESIGTNPGEEDVDEHFDQVDADHEVSLVRDQFAEKDEITFSNAEKTSSEMEEEVQEAFTSRTLTKMDKVIESEASGACEAAYTTLEDGETSQVGEGLGLQTSWKVGAALILALSILYVAVDLILHCVHCVASHLGAPKQLVCVLLHDILLLVGGGSRSTLKGAYSSSNDLKKPTLRRSKAPSEDSRQRSNAAEANTHDRSAKSHVAVDAPHHPSPSFTCVAMLLMAGRMTNDSIALAQDTQTQPTSNFVPDSNEALNIIQQNYERELAAAQRIQHAWKATQRKNLVKQEWESFFNAAADDALGKIDGNIPIFRLLQGRSKTSTRTPRAETGTTSLRCHEATKHLTAALSNPKAA